MKAIIHLTALAIFIFTPTVNAQSPLRKEIAQLLTHHVPVDEKTITWTQNGSLLEVEAKNGKKIIKALIYHATDRLLDVIVDGEPVYHWPGIKVVGHRATMLLAPENTIAAIRKAQELGVQIMEIDIRQTKDGHLIVMHDPTVDRTTNGKGWVRNMTLAQIKALDAGSHFSAAFKGEPVPTLKEAIIAIRESGAVPDLDFKDGDLSKLKKVLDETGILGRVHVTMNGSSSELKQVSTWDKVDIRPSPFLGNLGLNSLVKKLSPPIINIPEISHDSTYLSNIHRLGLKSWVNIILTRFDEPSRLVDTVRSLPDYIQTDRPDFLVYYLKEANLLHPRSVDF